MAKAVTIDISLLEVGVFTGLIMGLLGFGVRYMVLLRPYESHSDN